MTHSLYTKFVLGYLLFGLLGFVLIATFSSHMTHEYLVRERSDAMYDEANLLASTYSDIYQGKTISWIRPTRSWRPYPPIWGPLPGSWTIKALWWPRPLPPPIRERSSRASIPRSQETSPISSGTSSACSPARPYRYWPPSPEISIHTAMWCSTCPWSGSWTARTRSRILYTSLRPLSSSCP